MNSLGLVLPSRQLWSPPNFLDHLQHFLGWLNNTLLSSCCLFSWTPWPNSLSIGKAMSHIRSVYWGVPVLEDTCPRLSALWGRVTSSYPRRLYFSSAPFLSLKFFSKPLNTSFMTHCNLTGMIEYTVCMYLYDLISIRLFAYLYV